MSNRIVTAAIANRRLGQVKALIPRWFKRFLLLHIVGVDMQSSEHPSRKWLEHDVLPALPKLGFGRTLFIGTASYTYHYEQIVRRAGGDWITCDVAPGAAVWGAREHVVARVEEIDRWFPSHSFDAVLLNGVLGYGINTEGEQNAAMSAIACVLRPGGLLLVGWDSDFIADPLLSADAFRQFRPGSELPFPPRRKFDPEEFVYDFQIRIDDHPQSA
jgi:SAM-dependent methyltransferase